MTNKPMLSVELRALLERVVAHDFAEYCQECGIGQSETWKELRALLDKPVLESQYEGMTQEQAQAVSDGVDEILNGKPAAQHQGETVAQSEFEPDAICLESDGCPTEGAVLKRFWRENQPDPVLCEFYEAEDFPSLVRELVGHVAQLQEAAKRNVKPWEDTFPPTLLPAYIARINAEQPAPVAVVMPDRKIKSDYWGYIEQFQSEAAAIYNSALDDVARLNVVKP